jgi:hypothetical protein
MIDSAALTLLIEQQVKDSVNDQVQQILSSDEWLTSLENKILDYTQQRILAKFANSSTMPEIIESVKQSVSVLFKDGQIPGIDQYVDNVTINQAIDIAVQDKIVGAVENLKHDPLWLEKIERLVNRTVADTVLQQIGLLDLNQVINQRVDEVMNSVKQSVFPGIADQATQIQVTIMDDTTVVENKLTTRNLDVFDTMQVSNLVVTGLINTDCASWHELASNISQHTLTRLNDEWRDSIVKQVAEQIKLSGIDFNQVTIDGQALVADGSLSTHIRQSNLQTVGELRTLSVKGTASFHNTAHVVNKRVGINTQEPEMALSVWDEEVAVLLGKHKDKTAYVGTKGAHGIVIGVNRSPQIDIDVDGLTTIKRLRVGSHKISHSADVPGWSGTKGDIVFNSNPGADRVFAWVCLGSFRWQVLKAAE